MKRLTLIAIVVFVGFFVGFGSGLVENDPGFVHVPENRYYGFPLVWRMVNTATGDKFASPVELFIDIVFGTGIVSLVVVSMSLTMSWLKKKQPQEVKPKQKQKRR